MGAVAPGKPNQWLEGIGLGGYRSFGADIQLLGPLVKVNLLVGQNNAGKSNILRFLVYHLAELKKAFKGSANYRLSGEDLHIAVPGVPLSCFLGIGSGGTFEKRLANGMRQPNEVDRLIEIPSLHLTQAA